MRIGILLFALMLGGCQTADQQAEDPIGWGRIDCQRLVPGTPLSTQFEQAKLVCLNRAEAAGIAGTAAMPTGYGLGGAIASGINAGIASSQIQTATAKSCMAEYGYMHSRKSEFEARCPVAPPLVPPASAAPSVKTKGKKAPVVAVVAPRPAVVTAPPPTAETEQVVSERDRDLMNLQR